MKERPILMRGDMVRATLADLKTNTRRVVKLNASGRVELKGKQWHIQDPDVVLGCPYGVPGDRLWVRETWHIEGESRIGDDPSKIVRVAYRPNSAAAITGGWSQESKEFNRPAGELGPCANMSTFRADGNIRWRPAIFMPRWASRITLEVADVRAERLQDITLEDICAEGVKNALAEAMWGPRWWVDAPEASEIDTRDMFSKLWDSINAKRGFGWDTNPYVWRIAFKRVQP
jgi:hypothetical protein